jgi:hypothetical protein
VVGYRDDFRLSGDNDGSIVNLQLEYFKSESGGDIITEISEAPSRDSAYQTKALVAVTPRAGETAFTALAPAPLENVERQLRITVPRSQSGVGKPTAAG